MKVLLAALLIVATPVLALAQSRGSSSGASSSLPPILGPIGLPLPPIGLDLPPIGLSPVVETQSRGRGELPGRGPGHRGRRPGFKHVPTIVYFLPTTDWWPSGLSDASGPYSSGTTTFDPYLPPVADPPLRLTGTLRMELQPAGPHPTYIDGAYIGTLDDFNSELILEPGRHSVEVRAPGFDPLTFDVSIQAGRSITYRGTLKSAAADPREPRLEPAPAPPAPPAVIYFVPGCYLGNVPPAQLKLPAKCDLSKTITSQQQ
jgi:hypothetical protein